MYDFSVPMLTRGLQVLLHILDKGISYATEHKLPVDDLVNWRLVEDMKPLSFQIQVATNTTKFMLARVLKRSDLPVWADDESTVAQLKARVQQTIDLLAAVKKEEFEGREGQECILPSGGKEIKLTGLTYLQGYALPNFYFHVVTAYDILRAKGVQVGKQDFLRPGQ